MWILQSNTADADAGAMIFRLSAGAIKTIGRATPADFVVDAALVSRLHCRLTAGGDRIDIEDLKSTNGTFVNDARVERASVGDGDRLRVGRMELTVRRAAPNGNGI